jgi:hypothetical protein
MENKTIDSGPKTAKQIDQIHAAFKQELADIYKVIKENRFIWQREDALVKLGYNVEECRMGSGGVGQVRRVGDVVRVQIGYGHSKNNYAKAVILPIN